MAKQRTNHQGPESDKALSDEPKPKSIWALPSKPPKEQKLLQLRISEQTDLKIDELTRLTGIHSRTHVVAGAIQAMYRILNMMELNDSHTLAVGVQERDANGAVARNNDGTPKMRWIPIGNPI